MRIVLQIFERNKPIQKLNATGNSIEECVYKAQKLMREKGLIEHVIL